MKHNIEKFYEINKYLKSTNGIHGHCTLFLQLLRLYTVRLQKARLLLFLCGWFVDHLRRIRNTRHVSTHPTDSQLNSEW